VPDVFERAALSGRQLRDGLARPGLTVDLARLYSQHVRLRTGQAELRTFDEAEAAARLFDAVRLVDASLAARDAGDIDWRDGFRRAAEILEWLAHPETNVEGLPFSLLGSACYQLAGYPARAASLARRKEGEQDAPLLRLLLQGEFEELLSLAVEVAVAGHRDDGLALPVDGDTPIDAPGLHRVVASEIASALGVVVAELRWGSGRRTTRAIEKLRYAAPAILEIADPYEWLLVRLVAAVAETTVGTSLRVPMSALAAAHSQTGREIFERYTRLAYLNQQITVWPSQDRGLTRLAARGSFALCTPTGSGKTRVAEVALLEGLFQDDAEDVLPPLCIYIVPTRSLAAEVEARFSRVLRRAGGARAVTVTGLYGGTDWGPSDDWLLSPDPTVLICTQEKCEALIRFFGDIVTPRLRLVILDEAHEVQYAEVPDALARGESRSLRLESLMSRLRARVPNARFIAISAVAQQLEQPLARWISGDADPDPVRSDYRSTRQLVGRLICFAGGITRINYDVLDGQTLELQGIGDAAPYVPRPFPPHPPAPAFTGPQKGMAPFALWVALNLARVDGLGAQQTVLISVIEGIANFAGWCTALLEDEWTNVGLPAFFVEPEEGTEDWMIWQRALAVTGDLFGETSREFRLLQRGIVVHHGRMPGRLPRLLVELVERRIVRVVLATSTLTQGVNLPFETILIPGLSRQTGRISPQEFRNLVGRAGRPGTSTEGQALVLMLNNLEGWQRARAEADYRATINEWMRGTAAAGATRSPLAALIEMIWQRWDGGDPEAFEAWLEMTAVDDPDVVDEALEAPLGTLDAVLLAVLAEGEGDVDGDLRRVWRESFARYASAEEERLSRAFQARGVAVARRFALEGERQRVYRTSLAPRDARALYEAAPGLVEHLQTGNEYWRWDADERLAYIETAVELVSGVPRFAVSQTAGRQSTATWRDLLRWWLDPSGAGRTPTVTQVGKWHDFISTEFAYRFAWGLTAMALSALEPDVAATPDAWRDAGIPWAALWIKEMLQWGSLDPVAAYLLSRQIADTRAEAEGWRQATTPKLIGSTLETRLIQTLLGPGLQPKSVPRYLRQRR
jgi:DEAD/DEAH box helicase